MTDRRIATIAALLGIFLAGIEGTIVSTAMPTIVAKVGGLDLYAWVFAIYMLFAAVTMPLFGKMADAYGRRRVFTGGVTIFVIGSLLAGTANSMPELIVYRAVMGVGGGAMFTLPYTILGVVYPPEKRGKALGYGSAAWGISSVVGPLLGYILVSQFSWRWIFFLAVPVGIGAIAMVHIGMDESTGSASRSLDVLGAVTLTMAVGALLVGLQLLEQGAGNFRVGGLLALSLVGLGGFILAERRSSAPILPLELFHDRVFQITNALGFLTSFVVFAVIAFVPLFVETIRPGAGSAALAIVPIAIGWSGTSILVGRVVDRVGGWPLIALGMAIVTSGFVLGLFWSNNPDLLMVQATMAWIGIGMGTVTIPLLTTIQNHLGIEQMGVATASQQFFRNLGGTIGVSVLGAILTITVQEELSRAGLGSLGDLRRALLDGGGTTAGSILGTGLHWMFLAGVGVCLLALGLVPLLPRRGG